MEIEQREVDEEVEREAFERGQQIALNLLSYKMRTRAELFKKLAEREIPKESAKTIVKSLEDAGYIGDVTYAETFIRSRQERMGRWRIERELENKGISESDIEHAYRQLEAAEETVDALEAAKEVLAKKVNTMSIDPNTYASDYQYRMKIQQKWYRFLSGRGFSAAVIRQVIDLSEFFNEL
jgi:regulatory protein